MALEGSVKDFGLSEIFQMIALQKKSGMLSVSAKESMAIFFQEGMIISTRDRRNRSRDPLKDYLLRYGFIGKEEMNRIQQIQAEANLDLTEILLSEKHFSQDELTTILSEQIQESIQEVLSWPKCYYKFITGNHVLHGVESFSSLNVEGLLMESMRRIDEFPELQHIFPYEEMVFKRLEPETEPTELDSHEEFVYELLENELSLGELILRARMARFCTYEALKNLLEKQLLQIIKEPKAVIEEVREEVVEEIVNKKKKLVPTMASVILLLACFAIGEYTVPAVLQPGWSAKSSAPVKVIPAASGNLMAGSMRELSLRQLEASVCEGLEEYYAVNGSYPFTLEVLAVKKVVSEKIIENVHHSNLKYRLEKSGASYSLTRN